MKYTFVDFALLISVISKLLLIYSVVSH